MRRSSFVAVDFNVSRTLSLIGNQRLQIFINPLAQKLTAKFVFVLQEGENRNICDGSRARRQLSPHQGMPT